MPEVDEVLSTMSSLRQREYPEHEDAGDIRSWQVLIDRVQRLLIAIDQWIYLWRDD